MTDMLIDAAKPPGFPDDDTQVFDAGDRALFERLHRLEAAVARANALIAKADADAEAEHRVNLELRRHLDEYNQDRRAYEERIADLEAEIVRLYALPALPAYSEPRRARWRR